jgi:F-type H+-transporting ATPase subunit b
MAQQSAQLNTSQEHIQASEHARSFPPFESQTFASQLIWLALTFVTLYLLMSRIALPRIESILEQRRQRIEGDLAKAKRLKAESDDAIASYERSLADARIRAQSLTNEMRDKQSAEAENRRKELDGKLSASIAEAERSISVTRTSAMTNVRGIAADAAAAIVERLTGVQPPAHDVAAAVAKVLEP